MHKELEVIIVEAYENGVTMEEAEKIAGRFLHALLCVSGDLRKSDLDSRMRKSGLKAIRATVYNETCAKTEKKPTEAQLDSLITLNEIVQAEQDGLDKSEAERDELQRLYNIYQNAHIFYRGVAKGNFNG